MAEPVIVADHLTKDYGRGRGIFDVSFEVQPGEVFGYLGTNGSGKTTTIRHMMGFLKPDGGEVYVNGMNPWKKAPELMQHVSYIPGEIEFPSFATGSDFFKSQARYLGVKDFTRMNHLIELLGLDPSANLKRMSKGMKQKTAVVAALMAERDILIMDEPSTGLDPLMREKFVDIIREEKELGHTVFMSSHIFEEIEDVCDKVGILQDGNLKEILDLSWFRKNIQRHFVICFGSNEDAQAFARTRTNVQVSENTVVCQTLPEGIDQFLKELKGLNVNSLHEEHIGLEEYFMYVYRKEQKK